MKRSGLRCVIVPFFIVFFGFIGIWVISAVFIGWYNMGGEKTTAEPVSGVITQAYPVPTSNNGMTGYRVVVQKDGGNEEVFNIFPSIAMGHMNSALMFSKFKIGDHVTATATGFKNMLWWPGYYRNIYIVSVDK